MDRRTVLAGLGLVAVSGAAGGVAAGGAARADTLALGVLPGTRYPDPRIESLDKRFTAKIGNAGIERIATGLRWAEGPCWFGDGGYLLVSDIPNNRILRWLADDGRVSVFRAPSNYANGNTRDLQGRLVTCEHQTRRVTRTAHDGTITVLCDGFGGKRLNAPNDVVVARDGAVWFTDPGYGIGNNYEGDAAQDTTGKAALIASAAPPLNQSLRLIEMHRGDRHSRAARHLADAEFCGRRIEGFHRKTLA